jgi:hypothetical protein
MLDIPTASRRKFSCELTRVGIAAGWHHFGGQHILLSELKNELFRNYEAKKMLLEPPMATLFCMEGTNFGAFFCRAVLASLLLIDSQFSLRMF